MAAVKLSTSLIIIIAVSSLVGCVAILFLILRYCRRPKSAPLPPIQPLAYHREKESSYLSHPHAFRNSMVPNHLEVYESDSSLLKPSGKPSFQTDGSDGTPSSSDNSFSTPPSQANVTLSPQLADDEQASATQQYVPTSMQALSASRGSRRPRSRVISVASTNTTFTQLSPRPTSIIRGAPHSALSNVQIVLPTPLAPQLQNHMVLIPLSTSQRSNSEQDLPMQDQSRARKSSSNSGHRYRRSLDTANTANQARRSESQAELRGQIASDRSIPPPLPSAGDVATSTPPFEPPKSASQGTCDEQAGQLLS